MKRVIAILALLFLMSGTGVAVAQSSSQSPSPSPSTTVKSCDELQAETISLNQKIVDQITLIAGIQLKIDAVPAPIGDVLANLKAQLASATAVLDGLKKALGVAVDDQTKRCPKITPFPELPIGSVNTGG